jgi:exopolysaccharide/PEP-CTERM locus tyrosine autokinase
VIAPRGPVADAAATKATAVVAGAPVPAVELHTRHIGIDQKALRSTGYLPEAGLERRFADHYRHIKRPLIERALGGSAEMRLILVSSALPGDGKTFTSINLALSIARERDVSVLLVDADAPRAHVSEVFRIREQPGLLDALVDESLDVESLVERSDVRGFEILPAGRLVENATELLASARMNQVAARLAAGNPRRLVLFDSAPLLVSSEARALLRIPGQVVLVVRADLTPRQAIQEALSHVDKNKLSGLVLNHTAFKPGGYYGYYGYGEDDASTST